MKNIERSAMPILSILWGLSRYHHKKYCFPSQNKIMSLLADRFYIEISKSTLNRWLAGMVSANFIKRVRRISYNEKQGYLFKSTLYKFTRKSIIFMIKVGISIKKGWFNIKADIKKNPPIKDDPAPVSVTYKQFKINHPEFFQ